MAITTLLTVVSLGSAAAAAALALRILSLRLLPAYPALFAFAAVQAFSTVVFSTASGSILYAWMYISVTPICWLIYVLLVKQLYGAVFASFPAIATVGRWSVYTGVAVTVLVSVLRSGQTFALFSIRHSQLVFVEAVGAGVNFCLGLLLLLLLLAISTYPLHLPKNIVVMFAFLPVLLLVETAGITLEQTTSQGNTAALNLVFACVNGITFIAWGTLLRREGQTEYITLRRNFGAKEAELLHQLESLNTLLLRVARK